MENRRIYLAMVLNQKVMYEQFTWFTLEIGVVDIESIASTDD
jgi:hypothetical protein